jgi:hypothetical protein
MKVEMIRIRMTTIEKQYIKEKADKLNMNLSEYIRFIAINGETRKKCN